MQISCLTMNPALPGVVRQIGYVVDDLDGSLDRWLQLGVGPWFMAGMADFVRRAALEWNGDDPIRELG